MHFWLSTARLYGRVPVPRNTSLNWFMPALVNSSVGSSCGTTGDDGTNVWPCFCTKKSMNCWRISAAVGVMVTQFRRVGTVPKATSVRGATMGRRAFHQLTKGIGALGPGGLIRLFQGCRHITAGREKNRQGRKLVADH